MLLVVAVVQINIHYADLYDVRIIADRRELFTRLIQATAASSFVLAAIYFWAPSTMIGRGVFLVAASFVIIVAVAWRVSFEWLSGRVGPRERLLLVGTSPAAVALARELYARRSELGVEIVGFIDPDPSKVGQPLMNPGIIGTVDDIPGIVESRGVDRVVVSLADARGTLPVDRLLDMKLAGVSFDHLASVYEEYTGKIAVENLRPSWFIFSDGFRKTRMLSAMKRVLDIACALAGLVLGAPLMVIVALAVRWTSPGAALYHQQRVGLNGRVFTVHKFRSMRTDAEATTGPVWASKAGDTRVTPIGGILRRARLDELPQLWNVLKGDMSFVGPRPERPEFVSAAERTDPLLRPAARRASGPDRVGPGVLHLRRQHRGRAAEVAVRPLLHQEPVDRARPVHHSRDHQDGGPPARRLKSCPRRGPPAPGSRTP